MNQMKINITLPSGDKQIEVDDYRNFIRDVESCRIKNQFVIVNNNMYISAKDIYMISIPAEFVIKPQPQSQVNLVIESEEENNQPDAAKWANVMKEEMNKNTDHSAHIAATLAKRVGRPSSK